MLELDLALTARQALAECRLEGASSFGASASWVVAPVVITGTLAFPIDQGRWS